MDEQRPLTSVHEALNNAVHASKPMPGKPISLRVDESIKNQAMAICERNGTTVSEYLRQALIALVSDYSDPTRG